VALSCGRDVLLGEVARARSCGGVFARARSWCVVAEVGLRVAQQPPAYPAAAQPCASLGSWLQNGDSKRRGAGPFAPTELRAYLPQRDLHRVTPNRKRSDRSRPQRGVMGAALFERFGLTAGPPGWRQLACRGKRDPHSEDPPWPRKSDRRPSLGRSRASLSQPSRLTDT